MTNNSYRQAIDYAIKKGNRQLPDGEKIPHWFPYLLRNSAATAIELEHGLDDTDEEYAENFRKAMHLLTKNAVPDFKVSLALYYLEHDADLEVEYDRQELAA